MSKDERSAARVETAVYRYVTIGIVYITKDVAYTPEIIEKVPKLKTIYYLSKPTERVNPPHMKSHFKNKKTYTPIKHTKRENGATKCPDWGGDKNAWWFHLEH